MSTRINPCHGCPVRDGCEQRDEFRRRVSGCGARSVTFRCERLTEALRPGRRVMISTPYVDVRSDYDDWRMAQKAVPATISGSHEDKFTCTIDPGHVQGGLNNDGEEDPASLDKYRFRKRMRAQRIIRFLDEPDMPVCKNGRVQRGGACDAPDGGCYCENEKAVEALAASDEWF